MYERGLTIGNNVFLSEHTLFVFFFKLWKYSMLIVISETVQRYMKMISPLLTSNSTLLRRSKPMHTHAFTLLMQAYAGKHTQILGFGLMPFH